MDGNNKNLSVYSFLKQVPGAIYQFQQNSDGSSCFPFSSQGIWDVYEVYPEEVEHDASKVYKRIHADDYERVVVSIQDSASSLKEWECEYRVVLPSKGERWLHGLARPEKLVNGAIRWHGYIHDFTEEKLAKEQIETFFKVNLESF